MPVADAARAPDKGRIALALLAVYLFWGSSYLATRVGVQQLPPFLFGALRFFCAGLIMFGVARWQRLRLLPQGGEWRDLLITSFFGFAVANGAGVWTMQFLPSSQSALLNTTVPCWMVLLGAFGARGHRPPPLGIAGLVAGALGAVLLIEPWSKPSGAHSWPEVVLLLGCLGWAINSVYQRNRRIQMPVATLIAWQMLCGSAMLTVMGLLNNEPQRWHWSPASLLPLAYLVIFASCIAHTAYAWLAPRTTPTSLGTYAYVNPVVALVLGWLVLGESLSAAQCIGMALVLGSVLLINASHSL
jgi:drug/metabolite transporter (DMT)-like permease